MIKLADISECGKYRYSLSRIWDESLNTIFFVMLNPSTADASEDDPTIRRCIGFAKLLGFGSLTVNNLFAYRSTDPKNLRTAISPIGPENDKTILALQPSSTVICAWGAYGGLFRRDQSVIRLLKTCGVEPKVLKLTAAGHPCHPLYLSANLVPFVWQI